MPQDKKNQVTLDLRHTELESSHFHITDYLFDSETNPPPIKILGEQRIKATYCPK